MNAQILTFTTSGLLNSVVSQIAYLLISCLIPLMKPVMSCKIILKTTSIYSSPCTVAGPAPFTNMCDVGCYFSSCYSFLLWIGAYMFCTASMYKQCSLIQAVLLCHLQPHVTPAASSGIQLCTPTGLCLHDNKSCSLPLHRTSSSKMGPFPM